jgi:hypothetical protein
MNAVVIGAIHFSVFPARCVPQPPQFDIVDVDVDP